MIVKRVPVDLPPLVSVLYHFTVRIVFIDTVTMTTLTLTDYYDLSKFLKRLYVEVRNAMATSENEANALHGSLIQ